MLLVAVIVDLIWVRRKASSGLGSVVRVRVRDRGRGMIRVEVRVRVRAGLVVVAVAVDPRGPVVAHVQAPQLRAHRPELAARLLQPGLHVIRSKVRVN